MTDDTNKMLRAIISGQSVMKSELIGKIDKLDKKLSSKIDGVESEMKGGFKEVNERIDKLGKSLAYLEDDAPTRNEFDELEVRVKKVEQNIASV